MRSTIKPTKKPPITCYFLSTKDTGIVDPVSSHIYIAPSAPHGPPDTTTPTVSIGTATGKVQRPSATTSILIPCLKIIYLPQDTSCQILPTHSLGLAPSVMPNAQFFYQARCHSIIPNRQTYSKRMARKIHAKIVALCFASNHNCTSATQT